MSKKPTTRPVYMECRRLMDPQTGEIIGALVPASDIDRVLMRQRRVSIGKGYRVAIQQARNSRFHRLVHALGALVAENVEAFAGMDSHAAIKRLQRETGLFCEEQECELGDFGKIVVKVAQSLSFDAMDEADFRSLYQGICRHVAVTYWPGLDESAVEVMAGLMPAEAA